jgi:hypothetical protein
MSRAAANVPIHLCQANSSIKSGRCTMAVNSRRSTTGRTTTTDYPTRMNNIAGQSINRGSYRACFAVSRCEGCGCRKLCTRHQ